MVDMIRELNATETISDDSSSSGQSAPCYEMIPEMREPLSLQDVGEFTSAHLFDRHEILGTAKASTEARISYSKPAKLKIELS